MIQSLAATMHAMDRLHPLFRRRRRRFTGIRLASHGSATAPDDILRRPLGPMLVPIGGNLVFA